jgi:Clp amino terminal domain, pathogenicity island component
MEEGAQRICDLAEEAAGAGDAMSALRTLTELRREVDALAQVHVERALTSGSSIAEVARALEISRQAAHRRYRDLVPGRAPERPRRLRATRGAQAAVRLARERAIAAGEPLGTDHVLLGILGTDSDAARALEAEGVTFETALACARVSRDGDVGSDGDGSLRRILREAGRVAVARGQDRLGTDQLLLAALADEDEGARRTLAALGVTAASVRQRLGC